MLDGARGKDESLTLLHAEPPHVSVGGGAWVSDAKRLHRTTQRKRYPTGCDKLGEYTVRVQIGYWARVRRKGDARRCEPQRGAIVQNVGSARNARVVIYC
jgi:hypothetical protein